MPSVLQISQKKTDTADVVYLSGRLDSNTSAELDAVLKQLVDSGSLQIVLSLADVQYISSSGLRVMLICLRKMKKNHGALKIACLNPRVQGDPVPCGFQPDLHLLRDRGSGAQELLVRGSRRAGKTGTGYHRLDTGY